MKVDMTSSFSDYITARDELPTPLFKTGAVAGKHFKVIKYLSAGAYGAMYTVLDNLNQKSYAMKVELHPADGGDPGLQIEVNVLKSMQACKHYPRYVHSGHYKQLVYLIMQIVGPTLEHLRKNCIGRKFTIPTAHHLAYQCLEALQALHLENLVHRDVRPSHFAIGATSSDCRNVYVLDYHLVRRFTRKDGTVKQARSKAHPKGSLKYASPNATNNKDVSRRDDLYSWFYMIIECMKGRLPWSTKKDRDLVKSLKLSKVHDLLSGTPVEWLKMMNSISMLTFEQEPPYYKYKELILAIMQRQNRTFDDIFDWEPGGISYSQFSEPLAIYAKMPRNRRSSTNARKSKSDKKNGKETKCQETNNKKPESKVKQRKPQLKEVHSSNVKEAPKSTDKEKRRKSKSKKDEK